jgi:hypothetical protein
MSLQSLQELEKAYSAVITEANGNEYGVSTRGVCDGIYDWFPMVQRFTKSFLGKVFQSKKLKESKIILEPFMGSGNTLVACQEYGKTGFGVDVSPFFWFIAHVKTSNYNKADFQKAIDTIYHNKTDGKIEIPSLSSFETLFTRKQLRKLLNLREVARTLDQRPSELLLFALVSELINFSKAQRYGKGLRMKSGRSPNIEVTLHQTLTKMEKDYASFRKNTNRSRAHAVPLVGDARDLGNVINPVDKEKTTILPKGQIDSIITSPPYCNSADYVEMYKLEHWFLGYVASYAGFKKMSESTIRSHTSFSDKRTVWVSPVVDDICSILEKKKLYNKKIPTMIRGYFDDMHKALGQMRLLLRRKGNVILLVANSSYAVTPIPTDLLLAEAARDQCFRVEKIIKVRKLTTSGQQWPSMDSLSKSFLRESILALRYD